MKIYTLSNSQKLPITIEEAWDFLSDPTQLETITSSDMEFKTVTPLPEKMYEGMLMHYQIAPLAGIRLNWVTQITHIEKGVRFIDEQRLGPFRFWHHEHRLIEMDDGIVMQDIVHYVMPFSFIGRIAHWTSIRKLLESLFKFRTEQIETYFNNKFSSR